MSKYYTPELEEFHVGFEFEFQGMDNYWNLTGWGKAKVNISDKKNFGLYTLEHLSSVLQAINAENHIRVKHLDREDIESFGFLDITRTKGNYDSTDEKEKNVFLLLEDLPSIKVKDSRERIIIRIMNNGEIRIQKRYYFAVGQCAYPPYGCWRFNGRDHIFNGKIKNKSELGRVLKMVGVI